MQKKSKKKHQKKLSIFILIKYGVGTAYLYLVQHQPIHVLPQKTNKNKIQKKIDGKKFFSKIKVVIT